MKAEVLTAEKEHIYWSAIPEKARLAAYEKHKSFAEHGVKKGTANSEPLGKRRPIQQEDGAHAGSGLLFPQNRVVFARNIHPETNKTALRKLFSAAFINHPVDNSDGDPLEYVDYQKGLETVRPYAIPRNMRLSDCRCAVSPPPEKQCALRKITHLLRGTSYASRAWVR